MQFLKLFGGFHPGLKIFQATIIQGQSTWLKLRWYDCYPEISFKTEVSSKKVGVSAQKIKIFRLKPNHTS